MQSNIQSSDYWIKAMAVASFVNLVCSAIAVADITQPDQKRALLPQEKDLKPLAPLKNILRLGIEGKKLVSNTCSIERDSICEF
jgi:hypothetical protein